jgi:catechol 2,3-dioxygenase-like lactoylglutathione lyase family enzyme
MRAERVLETCLYVDDLDAAERFYTNVLALEVESRANDRHVFFRCGNAMFLLFNPATTEQAGGPVPPHGARGQGHVAFAVSQADIPAWKAQLQERRVALEAEVTWPSGGTSLYFRDPAGNSVELTSPAIWRLAEDS